MILFKKIIFTEDQINDFIKLRYPFLKDISINLDLNNSEYEEQKKNGIKPLVFGNKIFGNIYTLIINKNGKPFSSYPFIRIISKYDIIKVLKNSNLI